MPRSGLRMAVAGNLSNWDESGSAAICRVCSRDRRLRFGLFGLFESKVESKERPSGSAASRSILSFLSFISLEPCGPQNDPISWVKTSNLSNLKPFSAFFILSTAIVVSTGTRTQRFSQTPVLEWFRRSIANTWAPIGAEFQLTGSTSDLTPRASISGSTK